MSLSHRCKTMAPMRAQGYYDPITKTEEADNPRLLYDPIAKTEEADNPTKRVSSCRISQRFTTCLRHIMTGMDI